jgi:tight adherence protein B
MSARGPGRRLGRPAVEVARPPMAAASSAAGGGRRSGPRRGRRRTTVVPDGELPTIARALARALAAGLPVAPALRRAADAVDERSAAALERAAQRIVAGEEPEAALLELGDGAPARLLRAAIAVNVELGGDLVHALEALAEGLADRERLRGELEVATAQSRMTARIVPGVPLASLAMLAMTDRSSLRGLLTTGPGLAIVSLSFSLTVVGLVAVNRILGGALR